MQTINVWNDNKVHIVQTVSVYVVSFGVGGFCLVLGVIKRSLSLVYGSR